MERLEILVGDCREVLRGMEAESVHCCVTSPPYRGLRDYGIEPVVWGGSPECSHCWGDGKALPKVTHWNTGGVFDPGKRKTVQEGGSQGQTCCQCGAWRGSLGLEPDPQTYVEHVVEVFREVKHVLRRDGTLWLNMGDGYAGGSQGGMWKGQELPDPPAGWTNRQQRSQMDTIVSGLKPKDLIGMPWMIAKALQAPYYTGRIKAERDRVWLAAMIDAEGTICGFDHDRADGDGHRSGIHIFVTNSVDAILEEAHRIWPASRHEHAKPGKGHFGGLDTYRWIVNGIENKLLLLRELFPYLIAKKQQAIVAYSMLLLMANAKRLGHSPQKDATLAKRRVLTGLLSDLNHQRPAVMPEWLTEPPGVLEPGWWLRSAITLCKLNPMPESVTDRPTSATEMMFLLTKSPRYFYDSDAVRESALVGRLPLFRDRKYLNNNSYDNSAWCEAEAPSGKCDPSAGRNLRNWWPVVSEPFPGAHFATFGQKWIEPCILAGTSEKGCCPECGAPWERQTNVQQQLSPSGGGWGDGGFGTDSHGSYDQPRTRKIVETIAWRPTCKCEQVSAEFEDVEDALAALRHPFEARTEPCTVLDPFAGSGTTGLVALRLGRRAVLIEIKSEYAEMARERCKAAAAQGVLLGAAE